MATIKFHAVVDKEQVIRPPASVRLPQGLLEVTVQPVPPPATTDTDPLAQTRAWLLELAAQAEQLAPNLPSDLAEHHDHYAHGKPLP
jgi:hypothetical protein